MPFFLWLASLIAEVASLKFVANGTKINEMKNEEIPAFSENSWTLAIKGSARRDNMVIPNTTCPNAFNHAYTPLLCLVIITFSTSSHV